MSSAQSARRNRRRDRMPRPWPRMSGAMHGVALRQRAEGVEPVEPAAGDPAVQQEHGGCAGRAGDGAHERGAPSRQLDALPAREGRLRRQLRHGHGYNLWQPAGSPAHSPTSVAAMTTLDRSAVDALLARARRDVDDGLLPACQVALALDGEVLVHEAFGDADVDTRFTIFSATKPFIASLIWQLLGEGSPHPRAARARGHPRVRHHGKDAITLDHVLQHTAGFPRAPLGAPRWDTHEGRRAAFADWRLNWEVGSQYEYHPTSAHWVLAELVHAVTGVDHTEALRTRVLEPLGLSQFTLGPAPTSRSASPTSCSSASRPPPTSSRPPSASARSTSARSPTRRCGPQRARRPRGRACRAAAASRRPPTWPPSTRRSSTTRRACGTRRCWPTPPRVVRNTFPDPLLGYSANRTRGLIVAGDDGRSNLRGMGRTVSPLAFGHNGAAGQVAWADPATGPVVLLPHQRARPERAPRAPAHHRGGEPRRRLRGLIGPSMRITAKVDYAVRAAVELAAHGAGHGPQVADEGRRRGHRPGHPGAVPRDDPGRAAPVRSGRQPAGLRGRLLARPARRPRSPSPT